MNVQSQIDRLIAYQAAEWYECLKESRSDRHAEFAQWVAESPRHMAAFLAVAGEAPLIRKAFAKGALDVEKVLREAAAQVVPLRGQMEIEDTPSVPSLAGRGRGTIARWKIWAVAATVATLSVGAAFYLETSWQHFETPIGEQRTIQLAEGSLVNLNALSQLAVRFDDARRDIRLLRGEATFKVAPDRTRPFKVQAGNAEVEAIGTQFNIYVRPDGRTTVAVLEGKVRVTGDTQAMLAAGDEANITAGGAVEQHSSTNIADAIAWQRRKLVFKRTPLDEMAREFNRYNKNLQIHLEGVAPRALRYTGAFDANDPQSLATLLAREPDLSVQQQDGKIFVRKR